MVSVDAAEAMANAGELREGEFAPESLREMLVVQPAIANVRDARRVS